MKIWEIPDLLTLLHNQKDNIELCRAIIADAVSVPEDAILWVEDGVGFFIDNDYGYFKIKTVIIFRVISEYLIIHIGLNTLEHQCFPLADPNYTKAVKIYLKEKAGRWIRRI